MPLAPHIKQLLERVTSSPIRRTWDSYDGPRFTTNSLTSGAGTFYEKIRYTLDYQDENTIRRRALERMLRRLVVVHEHEDLAHALLEELVRTGYVPNDTLPEHVTAEVQAVLDKYRLLAEHLPLDHKDTWTHAATEVELFLFPNTEDELVFNAVYEQVCTYLFSREKLSEIEAVRFREQIYIACRRSLLHDTDEELRYRLLLQREPHWRAVRASDAAEVLGVAERYPNHVVEMQERIASPVHGRIEAQLKNESIFTNLLRILVRQYGRDVGLVLENTEELSAKVSTMLNEQYKLLIERIKRSRSRAIIYILVTKLLIGLLIELPYELMVLGEIHHVPLLINVVFFPILLSMMVYSISFPDTKNTERVVAGIVSMVRGDEHEKVFIRTTPGSIVQRLGFSTLLTILGLLTFGGIVMVLTMLSFTLASMALFLFFLMVVSYFGLRIRYKAREWTFVHESESVGGLMWYLVTLPIIQTGHWLSTRLSSVNIFVLLMDVIIETPFKLLLGSFDAFVAYTKETRRHVS